MSFADDLRKTAERKKNLTIQEACLNYIRDYGIVNRICSAIESTCQEAANNGQLSAIVRIEPSDWKIIEPFCSYQRGLERKKGIRGVYTRLTTPSSSTPNGILDKEARPEIEKYCEKLGIEFVSIRFVILRNHYISTYCIAASFKW